MRTEYLTPAEVRDVTRILMPQNGLIVRVMLHTGLRIGDVLALRVDDLKPTLWITEQKTGKRRRVGLGGGLLDEIRAQTVPGNPWAFPGRKPGRPKTRQAVWYDLKRAARAYRVPANVGPHSARKAYAVSLYQHTGSLESVRRALNHDRPEVTLLYALADKLRKKPPR